MARQRSWVSRKAIVMGEPLMELRRQVYRRSISRAIGGMRGSMIRAARVFFLAGMMAFLASAC
jgi:hypothetical protein